MSEPNAPAFQHCDHCGRPIRTDGGVAHEPSCEGLRYQRELRTLELLASQTEALERIATALEKRASSSSTGKKKSG